jgi:hypothetical protein
MRIRTIYLLFSILLTGAGTGRLWAQTPKAPPDLMDTSLEDLMKVEIDSVHGASKYRRKVAAAPLTNSPQVLGQANLSVLLLHKKLFASMDLQYVSRRRTLAGDFAGAHAVPSQSKRSPQMGILRQHLQRFRQTIWRSRVGGASARHHLSGWAELPIEVYVPFLSS